MIKCFLCGAEISGKAVGKAGPPIVYNIFCEECGAYRISDVLLKALKTVEDKNAIIWFIKKRNTEIINEENIDYIRQGYRIYQQLNKK
jgi:C4-type Zn-finger protein